ncbi:MAG: hypothetical protein K2K31_00345 [Clostridia bacterium]|nr:hypothetical protein [Clostridia bacterium]
MKKLFKIESDCLDIVSRLKAIDKDYFVVFNEDSCKFEVHNSSQFQNTLCLILPFDVLDERTIDMVLKTRVQNADKLFQEMEEENKKLEKTQIKQILNDFEEKFYDS